MTDSNKHWGFCLSFAFSISTICIPSLELPQPIQTAAILNRATHTRLPTEGHYCESWPQLSQAKQLNSHSRKKTAALLWWFMQKIFGFWKNIVYMYKSRILLILGCISVWVSPLSNPPSVLISISHSEWKRLILQRCRKRALSQYAVILPKSLIFLSVFHPEALLHPSISVPVGL